MTRFISCSSLARCVLLALLPVWLAGCAMLEQAAAPAPGSSAAARPYHAVIDIGGRLTVRYQQNGAEQVLHGSFSWLQTPARSTVTLLSPLGQTMAQIEVTPALSTLTLAGQPPRSAADVDTLAAQALGWPLPVAGLRDWLQGYALDRDGRRIVAGSPAGNSLTTTDGWQLSYAAWSEDTEPRPRRIDLERNTPQAGNVALRIVIDSWQPRD
jgi:outer membrane lipoprotein LolB